MDWLVEEAGANNTFTNTIRQAWALSPCAVPRAPGNCSTNRDSIRDSIGVEWSFFTSVIRSLDHALSTACEYRYAF
jgi:hypothetical protein